MMRDMEALSDKKERKKNELFAKMLSALFYAISSILIVFVNKILLTNYRFPSFLCAGIGQMLATVIILFIAGCLGFVSIPVFNKSVIRKIFPLPLIYFLNLISGLGGTQKISLPMFTVLRRFSILMVMIMEYFILGVKASFAVKLSVSLMIFGSIVAALFDLSFDTYGYFLILINDVFTAANGVYMKKKLEAKEFDKYSLLYYNSLFMVIPSFIIVMFTNEVEKVQDFVAKGNMDLPVVVFFILSCVCGFILNYSVVLCTHYNSALTTACVGPIKNLFVTYVGMFSSGDYVFSWNNFIGINISVLGSILYTYVTFRTKSLTKERSIIVDAKPNEREPFIL